MPLYRPSGCAEPRHDVGPAADGKEEAEEDGREHERDDGAGISGGQEVHAKLLCRVSAYWVSWV